jgi:hypothetical protein
MNEMIEPTPLARSSNPHTPKFESVDLLIYDREGFKEDW